MVEGEILVVAVVEIDKSIQQIRIGVAQPTPYQVVEQARSLCLYSKKLKLIFGCGSTSAILLFS